jgi:pyrroline-5-carboxylate reductase
MKNLGFIGAGRMATALARGCAAANLVAAEGVLASDPHEESRTKFAEQLSGAQVTAHNAAVLAACDTIVLAVKPQMMDGVLAEIHARV